MNIKDILKQPDLADFKASEGWVDKWKLSYGIREKQISGESLDVSETSIESWMERLKELCKEYQLKDIWNLNESGCFFKALPTKSLSRNRKKGKGGKRSKQRMTVDLFCKCGWRESWQANNYLEKQKLRCFKKENAAVKIQKVAYFAGFKVVDAS